MRRRGICANRQPSTLMLRNKLDQGDPYERRLLGPPRCCGGSLLWRVNGVGLNRDMPVGVFLQYVPVFARRRPIGCQNRGCDNYAAPLNAALHVAARCARMGLWGLLFCGFAGTLSANIRPADIQAARLFDNGGKRYYRVQLDAKECRPGADPLAGHKIRHSAMKGRRHEDPPARARPAVCASSEPVR